MQDNKEKQSNILRLGECSAAYDSPMFSKSLTMTATWARFAASATSVKSLRKASVEGVPATCFDCWRGATAGAEAA